MMLMVHIAFKQNIAEETPNDTEKRDRYSGFEKPDIRITVLIGGYYKFYNMNVFL